MNGPWMVLILLCSGLSIAAGHAEDVAQALLASGREAVELTLTLLGAMTLWGGLMEILQETGDVKRFACLFRHLAASIFPGVKDEACWSAMGLNMAANLLGLGNAATPAGMEAARRLSSQGPEGLRALAMLLVMNNAGLQLLPTTMITMRQEAGSLSPGAVWLPTLAASALWLAVGILLMQILQRKERQS